ncbi:MAG TPA: hypothetical protein V6D07_00465 [Trichocoleus sp.]
MTWSGGSPKELSGKPNNPILGAAATSTAELGKTEPTLGGIPACLAGAIAPTMTS